MKKLVFTLLLTSTSLYAQPAFPTFIKFWDSSTLAAFWGGDSTNNALRVNCIVGCSGGGSITANQGTANTQTNRWPFFLSDGVNEWGTTTNPFNVRFQTAQPVTQSGTWTVQQGTPPWSIIFSGAQPISGTVTSNQGTPATTVNRWPVQITDGTDLAFVTAAGEVNVISTAQPGVDIGDVTINNAAGASAVNIQDGGNIITVDGTVITTPPANASTNVAQFGGTNIVTGTGASGLGIPRVTVSNDSTVILGTGAAIIGSLTANQSINLAQVAGTTTVTGGVAGTQGVGGLAASGATKAGNPNQVGGVFNTTPPTVTTGQAVEAQYTARGEAHGIIRDAAGNIRGANVTAGNSLQEDTTSIAGTAVVTSAAGVQRVGIAGNANAAFDAANNAAEPANVLSIGVETIAQGTQPTAATAANIRRILASTEGVQYIQAGNSNRFSCFVQAVTATTQCQAAPGAGLRAYVTSAHMSNQAATVQTLDIIFGTGANCATAPTALTHKVQFGTAGTTTSPIDLHMSFDTPLIPTAANAICIRPSAATVFGATLTGFVAP